jgi:hypothetical protein
MSQTRIALNQVNLSVRPDESAELERVLYVMYQMRVSGVGATPLRASFAASPLLAGGPPRKNARSPTRTACQRAAQSLFYSFKITLELVLLDR